MNKIKTFERHAITESLSSDLFYIKSMYTPGDDLYDQLAHDYYFTYLDYHREEPNSRIDSTYHDHPHTFVTGSLTRKERLAFGEWLYDKWSHDHGAMVDDYGHEIPLFSISYIDKILRNEWLVHMTNHKDAIISDGFEGGIMDPKHLAYTFSANDLYDRSTSADGWFFAYHHQDVDRYAIGSYNNPKYGTEAVMFVSSGVKIWHYGDNEPQVIFNGKYAKNLVPINRDSDKMWNVEHKESFSTIFEDEEFDVVVQWVIDNFDQYRKVIAY